MKTPQQAAAAWRDSAPKAQANYEAGVRGFNGDWAGATIRQKTTMASNFATSVNNGTWESGVNSVGNQGWKDRTVAKLPNFGQGFTAGADRQAASIAKIISAEANIVGSLPPRGTYEQNKARATAVMDQLHALKGTLGA